MENLDFEDVFTRLTENKPFPWQIALYHRFLAEDYPTACNIPTGLGKTSVIPIWLIALATRPKTTPRRLVYVVNRRTVVDQATNEARNIHRRLHQAQALMERLAELSAVDKANPLAISTLRGQFADNREWSADPSRPAIIVGTVDMIGSRLLFSGYGIGFKSKPLHAGFLGQDVLLVHDEAHLEPAFQDLINAIEKEQRSGRMPDFRPLRVMELTATPQTSKDDDRTITFGLTNADRLDPTVKQRIMAKKQVELLPIDDDKKLPEKLAELSLKHKDSNRAVLVFARSVEAVEKVAESLRDKCPDRVEVLTGTLRGKERDELVNNSVFRRFLPKSDSSKGTVYLVCTSAGEVGVNISADDLVCDLSTFESMAQRFGRVNRFGLRDDTRIDIVHPASFTKKDKDGETDRRREKTLELLRKLKGDGSPDALSRLDPEERLAAFSPKPTSLPTSDILFDAWALTTIQGHLPGRPIVEPYLHGLSENDPPRTTIAWREEVEILNEKTLVLNRLKAADIFDLYPLKPHEELSAPTFGKNKVFEQLEAIAKRDATKEPKERLSAWVIDPDGTVTIRTLEDLVERDNQKNPRVDLAGRTVILPPAAGGFNKGLLKGDEPYSKETEYDVSDQWYAEDKGTKQRVRVWEDDEELDDIDKTRAMRRILRLSVPPAGDDDDAPLRYWSWFTRPKSADDDGSKTAKLAIKWQHHTTDVEKRAKRLANLLLRDFPELQQAVIFAARFHDLGKMRIKWQRSIGNPNPLDWHAKSGPTWKPFENSAYRHEFGSLLDAQNKRDFQNLGDDLKELVLHLIAAHHGRGRPHFPLEEAFDHEPNGRDVREIAAAVPQRFARLQHRYGRWGLAYLESLLRAADIAASINPTPIPEGQP